MSDIFIETVVYKIIMSCLVNMIIVKTAIFDFCIVFFDYCTMG